MSTLKTFYLWRGNEKTGPHTLAQLREMLKLERVTLQTLAAESDGEEWLPLSTWSELIQPAQSLAAKHPPVQAAQCADAGGAGAHGLAGMLARALGISALLALAISGLLVVLGSMLWAPFMVMVPSVSGYALLLGILAYGFKRCA